MTYFKEWLQETTNPQHVMLVDDSEMDRQIILRGSEEFNIEWTMTRSYEEAIRALAKQNNRKRFRLIVLDLNLQSSPDGVALFRTIKETWPWIPVLVLSGHIDDRTITEMTKVGFVMFMKKPGNFDTRFFGELFFALSIPKKAGTVENQNTIGNI